MGRLVRLMLVTTVLAMPAMPCPGQTPLETAVKATYLYKFAPFVTWPETRDGPFHICVVGDDPFGPALDQAVGNQSYGTRPFEVVRLPVVAADSPCDVAYIGGSASQDAATALKSLQGAPVLTVTDASQPEGIVQFAEDNGRVRFVIDQDQAAASGLTISSKMLSLALAVKGGRR